MDEWILLDYMKMESWMYDWYSWKFLEVSVGRRGIYFLCHKDGP